MYTAKKLREENIAEYLLYMWQVEDLLRANGLDMENVRRCIIGLYKADEASRAEMEQWYAGLIEMMRLEGVAEKGHLQINKNVLIQLSDLHHMLLKSVKYPGYGAEFYKTLPYIVELRAKAGENKSGELETCFNALYGVLLMRLQQKEISNDTLNAISQISRFVSLLASYYHKDKKSPLFDKEDYE